MYIMPPTVTITMAETVTSSALCHLLSPLQWLKEHSDIMCITPPTVTITMVETVTSCALRHLQSLLQWLKHSEYAH